jgi:hypothetical protein
MKKYMIKWISTDSNKSLQFWFGSGGLAMFGGRVGTEPSEGQRLQVDAHCQDIRSKYSWKIIHLNEGHYSIPLQYY